MPKEQPCLSKHSLCATSSKNAKDKSNSTTLQAIRNTGGADGSTGRGSRCSSEKDSGYSDGSDWQQTDVEDQRSSKSQPRGCNCAETSQPGQSQELGQGKPGNPTLMSAGHNLSPIYIIKNIVLQQSDVIQNRGEVHRRNGSRQANRSGAGHVIFLQQPSLSTAQLLKPPSRKSSATGKKINSTYLPILNSYPRIAPHPSKKPPDESPPNNVSQSLNKRVCAEHKSDDAAMTRSIHEQHFYKQPKLAVPHSSSTSLSSSSPATVSLSQGSQSGSGLHTTSSLLPNRGLHRNSSVGARHRRFLNTEEILRQSGLLDITLRTKELLRQSNATERDIAQLRQHTELLCQAASNPGCSLSGIAALEYLHRSMAESGSYPSLRILQNLQDSASQPESISTGDTNGPQASENSEVTLSQLFSTIPNQNCPVPQQSHAGPSNEREAGYKSSEKVTFMPPDSSTG